MKPKATRELPRVAVYLRQSQDREGNEYGISRQRDEVMRLVAARGWTVVGEFVDNDVSATNRKPRPQFDAMMKAVDDGQIDVIVSRHVDRLLRKLAELESVIARCEPHGTTIVTAADGVDTSTDGGRLVARLLASVGQGESERRSARQLSAITQAAEQGRWIGGRRAFGYEADGKTIRPDEAAAVLAGYHAILAGEPVTAVVSAWNAAGFTGTQSGEPWGRSGVRDVLLNARNAGLRRHRPEGSNESYRKDPLAFVIAQAEWPAIVPEETWRAVVAMLTDSSRRTGTPGARALLTGVALCGVCDDGTSVNTGGARRTTRSYRCAAHAHLQRVAQPIEDYVEKLIVGRLSMPDALTAFAPTVVVNVAPLRAESDVLRRRLDDFAVDYSDGAMTRQQFRTATEKVRARLAKLEDEITAAGATDLIAPLVSSGDVAAAWSALSTARKRAVIDVLADVVIYSPGRGTRTFRPDTVEVDFHKRRSTG
ncbi:DNA invertase Pin-like site-specific DNA recombinase [Rhodococcus erythropolis]|uniref:recombinase family protein n=1 Tax=Rhodococcus TaxID=1827 RepID=UPI0018DA70DD|nr:MULTISPECIES: recombinase family protein [Rhodococcus erythropolis group]MCS4254944.1 DNA invertase Pin-like site-specific DNA recombinase [Rhodococcus erythropolis]MCW2430131.1 DNA invertase Pin-like site-specific DNA recombinase [Rhodococcus erythropolis]QPG87590.1 recombinase family protein [Rhodococcus qingshengii]